MAASSGYSSHSDPYRNFKFRIRWDGRTVAGASKASMLARTAEVFQHRERGEAADHRRSPGHTKHDAITLERGLTDDAEFLEWAGACGRSGSGIGKESSPSELRKDLTIELRDEEGRIALAVQARRCWVSAFQVVTTSDAGSDAVAFETLRIENEGWERDDEATDSEQPTHRDPPL